MQVERDVAAPPDAVWAVITDLEGSAEIISAIMSVERIGADSGFEVGTRWKETRKLFGREGTEEMEVTAIDEGRSYAVEADGSGAHYTSVMTIEPSGDGCRLSMSFESEPTTFIARIGAAFGKLLEGSTRKMLATDLDEIAAAAEARSQAPTAPRETPADDARGEATDDPEPGSGGGG